MVRKIGVIVASAVLCTSLGFSVAAAETASSLAQDRDNRTRQECLQNGGWYHEDSKVCETESKESKASAPLMETARQACERQGGWFHTDNGVCEMESKTLKK
jgi:hypothetical protein